MINFKLQNIDKVSPAGVDGNLRMNWFWLTEGELWLNFSDSILYEYTTEAINHFGIEHSAYNDYPIVRFIEDFTDIFNVISQSVPKDFYNLTKELEAFYIDAEKMAVNH